MSAASSHIFQYGHDEHRDGFLGRVAQSLSGRLAKQIADVQLLAEPISDQIMEHIVVIPVSSEASDEQSHCTRALFHHKAGSGDGCVSVSHNEGRRQVW